MRLRKYLSNYQIFAVGFALLILFGAVLLSMPFSSQSGEKTPFINSLFTSTSAVCVTGLVVYDTFTHWSLIGKLIIISLIQIGGLGFMTLVTIGSILLGKKIGAYERLLVTQSSGAMSQGQTVSLVKKIVLGSFLIEAVGAVLLSVRFCPQFGALKGIGYSLFHSISAFCNAGFDLFGMFEPFSSLVYYADDYYVNFIIMTLIVIGGIGFVVWDDFLHHKLRFKKYSFHSKIVISTTLALLIGGFLVFFILEYNNVLGAMSFPEKLTAAAFLSVSPRTAGFNTVNLAELSESSKLITSLLMVTGASPGSTAGGMKVTTLAVIIICTVSAVRGTEDTVIFKRRLSKETVHQAVAIFSVYMVAVILSAILISTIQGFPILETLFETASAAGTVGSTLGITTELNAASKIIIMLLMYMGRVGILTFAMAIGERKKKPLIARPTEKIMLG